jgi:hypothetical protein
MKRTTTVVLTIKAVAICLVIGVLSIEDAVGGDKEQLDLAFLVVEQTEGSKMFIDLVNGFMEPYLERYEPPASVEKADSNPLRKLLMEEFMASEEELKWNLAEIYTKYFSEAELLDIVRFFDSPAGKAWLENSAPILTEGEQVGHEWAKILTERVLHKFEKTSGKKIGH